MKNFTWLFALVLLACGEDNEYLNQLTESRIKWNKLKDQHEDSYHYEVNTSSWTGFGTETSLTVENGVVTARQYEEYRINQETGEREQVDFYTESGSELGTHEKGAAVATIDELYTSCKPYLRVNESENKIYFETDANGIMNLCGFVPRNCADDCFNGIRLTFLDWIN